MDALLETPTAAAVSRLVMGLLAKRGVKTAPAPSRSLKDAGLSSLDTVNLMLAVEAEFDIFIPQDRMTPDTFRSIASIEAMVDVLVPPR